MAKIQVERNRNWNKCVDEPGNPTKTSLDLFDEDKSVAMDEYGRIIRRDMFKGFTEEQKKKILADNQSILKRKRYDITLEKFLSMINLYVMLVK